MGEGYMLLRGGALGVVLDWMLQRGCSQMAGWGGGGGGGGVAVACRHLCCSGN